MSPSLELNLDEAKQTIAGLAETGIDLGRVCQQLQDDGVKAFADSYESLIASIKSKQAALSTGANR